MITKSYLNETYYVPEDKRIDSAIMIDIRIVVVLGLM